MAREPDIQGPAARAWRHMGKATREEHKDGICGWLVHAPASHPFWPWHWIYVVHLRPIEGAPPAKKHYEEAGYEFGIFAVDPERCPAPEPDGQYPLLQPPDVIVQFHLGKDWTAERADHDAARIAESAVRAIAAGAISPDQDYRSLWKELIPSTAACFREGGHVES